MASLSRIRVGSANKVRSQSPTPTSAPERSPKNKTSPKPPARTSEVKDPDCRREQSCCRDSPSPEPRRLENGDEITVWTDPATNQKLLLNARTGFVVNEEDLNRGRNSNIGEAMSKTTHAAPNSRIPRLTAQGPDNFLKPKPGTWASDFISSWENPVFKSTEEQIPQVTVDEDAYAEIFLARSCGSLAFTKGFDQLQEARLDKAGLARAEVIAQVDAKFILARLPELSSQLSSPPRSEDLLVLIDQHAADERIKVEALLAGLCQRPSGGARSIQSQLGYGSGVETCHLGKVIVYEINAKERRLFESQASHFAQWGVLYNCATNSSATLNRSKNQTPKGCRLEVVALPPCIAERCRTEPKLLIEMLRGEAWKLETDQSYRSDGKQVASESIAPWVRQIQHCPQGILDMINSRSCRSAIMFNDELTLEECTALVRKLSQCAFPFQCAHGRPSMVPLVRIGSSESFGVEAGVFGVRGNIERIDLNQSWDEWTQKS